MSSRRPLGIAESLIYELDDPDIQDTFRKLKQHLLARGDGPVISRTSREEIPSAMVRGGGLGRENDPLHVVNAILREKDAYRHDNARASRAALGMDKQRVRATEEKKNNDMKLLQAMCTQASNAIDRMIASIEGIVSQLRPGHRVPHPPPPRPESNVAGSLDNGLNTRVAVLEKTINLLPVLVDSIGDDAQGVTEQLKQTNHALWSTLEHVAARQSKDSSALEEAEQSRRLFIHQVQQDLGQLETLYEKERTRLRDRLQRARQKNATLKLDNAKLATELAEARQTIALLKQSNT